MEGNLLRQVSYEGQREDKPARQVPVPPSLGALAMPTLRAGGTSEKSRRPHRPVSCTSPWGRSSWWGECSRCSRDITHTGFALKIDGVIKRSSPDMLSLAAYVDAVLAGAEEMDADIIAQAIAPRAWPSLEERMAIFTVTGPWQPSPDPFKEGDR